jgi:hypothetical protein
MEPPHYKFTLQISLICSPLEPECLDPLALIRSARCSPPNSLIVAQVAAFGRIVSLFRFAANFAASLWKPRLILTETSQRASNFQDSLFISLLARNFEPRPVL